MVTAPQIAREDWKELTSLLDRIDRHGVADLSVREVKRLIGLYRQVTIDLSRARSSGEDPALVQYLNQLAARAHGRVYVAHRVDLRPVLGFLWAGFPRLVRKRWRAVSVAVAALVMTTLASAAAVVREPALAYSLFDENMVEYENIRLEKQQGEYRGNFTFGVKESSLVAAYIIANNCKVAVFAFAAGALACLPGLLLLIYNGRMLGTLSGLVYNGGYLVDFYSLILTHGVLELSAICIAGAAGLSLGWALIAAGARPRADALREAAKDAFGLLAGALVLLVAAGVIEAYVTPHTSAAVRWSVAAVSGLVLALYVSFGGYTMPRSDTSK